MLYKYNELLESKKLNPNEFKRGDYVQLLPNVSISKLHKKIIDIGDNYTSERVHKISKYTIFEIVYIHSKNTEQVVVVPIDNPIDIDLFFALDREKFISAEEYRINSIKYNL